MLMMWTLVTVITASFLILQYKNLSSSLEQRLYDAQETAQEDYHEVILSDRAASNDLSKGPIDSDKDNRIGDTYYYALMIDAETEKPFFVENGSLEDSSVEQLAMAMYDTGAESGKYSHYDFLVRSIDDDFTIQITFIDNSVTSKRFFPTFIIAIIILTAAFILIFVVSYYISELLIRPINDNIAKQQRFIADASHELKTPLAVVDVNIDMARQTPDNSKYLDYIKSETKKMNKLIQELLMLAEAEDEDRSRSDEDFNLTQTLEKVILPFEAAAFEKGVMIKQDLQENLMFKGNPEDLSRMGETLIENAIYHADADTNVGITLEKSHGHVIFSVLNYGETIPEEQQAHIFERFYRVDKSRNRRNGHFGLGLAIAQATAHLYHGEITLDSKDGRTIFTVTLPVH